ncbi:Ketohexokinase [Tolypocladium ophioglossoides CBS 100239]|uniref:Ketohexokinase n=1 Tax=Tolypocladium ophioglossoides (strain CBS 100239) TaxID=1163406 RepID=A0A0L0NHQ0_TOLOC|nr:Ketohexokinase [Tolypocladium ophioglossoides CBS 100239]
MKHLILVGACYLDTILRKDWPSVPPLSPSNLPYSVPRYPEEDSKLRATCLKIRRGGNCPNSLEVLQQLLGGHDDVCPYLVSCLPEQSSPATRRVMASFGSNTRVDFRHCIYRQGYTEAASCYIIRSEESGSRTLVNYNDLPEMTTREFEDIVRSFSAVQDTWWHFEGRIPDTTLDCIRMLRNTLPAAQISIEIEKPGRQGLPELAAEADVVFYSRAWAEYIVLPHGRVLTRRRIPRMTERRSPLSVDRAAATSLPKRVSETNDDGEGTTGGLPLQLLAYSLTEMTATDPWGCALGVQTARPRCLSPQEGVFAAPWRISQEEFPAVGAGDTFIAGMLYGLVCPTKAWGISQSVRFAVNLATLKVQREGFGLGADVPARGAP